MTTPMSAVMIAAQLGCARLGAVSFFDEFPPPPRPPEPPRFEPKAWMGPPPGWVGGWVPWHVVLIDDANVYSVITNVEAFPTGVQFTLASRFRPGAVDEHPRPGRPPMMMGLPDGPRFGVGFADGRKAMVGQQFFPGPDAEPEGPLLLPRGGGGGGEEWRMGLWLWPLPPPGPLTFVIDWAATGIGETAVVVEADELTAAAGRARQLWQVSPGDRLSMGGGVGFIRAVVEPNLERPADD